MRIAVLGAGSVGMTLASGFAARGHDVVIGTRDPSKPEVADWVDRGHKALDYRSAVDAAETVFLAVPGRVVRDVALEIGPEAFDSKIVVDVTNPVVRIGDRVEPAYGEDSSSTEELQKVLPSARVIKAFNEKMVARMMDPDTSKGEPHMRICGNDAEAKRVFGQLVEPIGWIVDDIGGAEQARVLEAKTLNWMRGTAVT